jgi:hypothetical protein
MSRTHGKDVEFASEEVNRPPEIHQNISRTLTRSTANHWTAYSVVHKAKLSNWSTATRLPVATVYESI